MLQSIHHRYGQTIQATDGEIGHVKDFYFDDENWTVRYLVADTGGWLTGRLVLVSPQAFGISIPMVRSFSSISRASKPRTVLP